MHHKTLTKFDPLYTILNRFSWMDGWGFRLRLSPVMVLWSAMLRQKEENLLTHNGSHTKLMPLKQCRLLLPEMYGWKSIVSQL